MNGRRIRLVVTTTVLLLLAGKGAYDIVSPPVKADETKKESVKSTLYVDTSRGAENYAVYFTNYWLTGDLESAKKYAAREFELPRETPKPGKIDGITPWGSRSLGEKKVGIIIRVKMKTEYPFFVEVPVVVDQGSYGVIGIPVFIPEPEPANAPQQKDVDMIQNLTTKQQVQQVIESFFRLYTTTGTPGDLANLFADQKERKVLPITALFENVESLEVAEPSGDRLYARCVAKMNMKGVIIPQPYEFWFVKVGDRWLIDTTNPVIPKQ